MTPLEYIFSFRKQPHAKSPQNTCKLTKLIVNSRILTGVLIIVQSKNYLIELLMETDNRRNIMLYRKHNQLHVNGKNGKENNSNPKIAQEKVGLHESILPPRTMLPKRSNKDNMSPNVKTGTR